MRRSVLTITILSCFCLALTRLISACTKEVPHSSLSTLALEIPEGFPSLPMTFLITRLRRKVLSWEGNSSMMVDCPSTMNIPAPPAISRSPPSVLLSTTEVTV